ncbi:MAG: hypothetical protein IPK33_17200 [Gemmatimonadetes bacterium]|nr:hypothetical protein [Gemmatimonadota bacterium]
MTYHVVLRAGPEDRFDLETAPGERLVMLSIDGAPGSVATAMPTRVWEILGHYALVPRAATVDLYRLAAAVYAADLRIPRADAFDGWSRDIILHLPVSDLTAWRTASVALHRLLSFLTGDHWTVEFREGGAYIPPRDPKRWGQLAPFRADAAALFSGGLDSAVGALDGIARGRALALVSHNSKGGDAFSSPAQRAVLRELQGRLSKTMAHGFRFRVDPPSPVPGVSASETTTRSRSMIFIALGLLVASGLHAGGGSLGAPLVVPENGLISLNVPLTRARYGAWSTRTTHPHTLDLLRQVLVTIGIGTAIESPYRFVTKGEMLIQAVDREIARNIARATISCSHPNQGRWLPRDRVVRSDGTHRQHCGTCVPCIIRRAAMSHAGWDDPNDYWFRLPEELDALKPDRASDARAFLIALSGRRPARPATLLRSGPLSVHDEQELNALLRVYDAGMDEVEALLVPRAME